MADSTKVLKTAKSKIGHDPIKLSLNTFNGNKYLDIRRYYTDEDGFSRPGSKGITISDLNQVNDLIDALIKHRDSINKYLQ